MDSCASGLYHNECQILYQSDEMSQVRACNRLRTPDSVDFFESVDAGADVQNFMLNAVVDVSGIEV